MGRKCSIIIVSSIIMLFQIVPTMLTANDYYVSSRSPLIVSPYNRLPLGSVKARTWLKYQLEIQRDGLTGAMEDIFPDIGNSPWKGGNDTSPNADWENGPYYLKGLITLAYTLDDPELKNKANIWINYIINNQRSNGDFGPRNNNWWPNMIVLYCMRDIYEATGDSSVLTFIDNYFQFQDEYVTLSGWAEARGGDNIDVVLWYYNVTGKSWLLNLADRLNNETLNWENHYLNGSGGSNHIVNFMQGMRKPALWYMRSNSQTSKNGFYAAVGRNTRHFISYGRIDDLLNGTEHLTNKSSTQGVEMCAIAERILSNSIAIKIMGDGFIGDQLEKIAYNSLPADLDCEGRGYRYYLMLNQPKAIDIDGTVPDFGFDEPRDISGNHRAICPGPSSGYMCCRCNYHWAWPKFIQNMWMATNDNGIAVAAYGPSEVTAKVGISSTNVTITEITDYPFRDFITLNISISSSTKFPLEVRIPEWCSNPQVRVNGTSHTGMTSGTFYRIDRTWNNGDVVTLAFPMKIKTSYWINKSVAVERGPLIYALKINQITNDITTRDNITKYGWNYPAIKDIEILPTSSWNYALDIPDFNNLGNIFAINETEIRSNPFSPGNEAIQLTVNAKKTNQGGWGSFRTDYQVRANEPPTSPLTSSDTLQTITLVPLGSTQIRITYFPFLGIPTKPESYFLLHNYPNPFNEKTSIKFGVKEPCRVVLKVYNLLGEEVTVLFDRESQADIYEVTFNCENLGSGVYFYRIEMGNFQAVRKMMVLK